MDHLFLLVLKGPILLHQKVDAYVGEIGQGGPRLIP